ncbi:hypothetical protein PUN28_019393 [Cardiocondyla obscurior]
MDIIINMLSNGRANQNVLNMNNDYSLLPEFPLKNIKELNDFQHQLQRNVQIRKQFVSIQMYIFYFYLQKNKISIIGGTSYANKVQNIFKYILTDTLCLRLSWTGLKGTTAIKDTAIATIVTDYVTCVEQCTLDDVRKIIQEWLRHAGDRVKYQQNKS